MFKFTEEQTMIRDMVREFTKNEVEPRDKWMDENGFDHDLHAKLCEAGLMGIHLPEQYGGGGGDAVTSEIVVNEIAKGSASTALFLDANWLAADMQNANCIVSLNHTPGVPIFDMSHYGMVGDYRTLIPAILSEIKNRKN